MFKARFFECFNTNIFKLSFDYEKAIKKSNEKYKTYETSRIEIWFYCDHILMKTNQQVDIFQQLANDYTIKYSSKRLMFTEFNAKKNYKQ